MELFLKAIEFYFISKRQKIFESLAMTSPYCNMAERLPFDSCVLF